MSAHRDDLEEESETVAESETPPLVFAVAAAVVVAPAAAVVAVSSIASQAGEGKNQKLSMKKRNPFFQCGLNFFLFFCSSFVSLLFLSFFLLGQGGEKMQGVEKILPAD